VGPLCTVTKEKEQESETEYRCKQEYHVYIHEVVVQIFHSYIHEGILERRNSCCHQIIYTYYQEKVYFSDKKGILAVKKNLTRTQGTAPQNYVYT